MKVDYLSRHALLWLFVAQIAVISPYLSILPLWTALVWGLVVWWYLKIFRGDWHFPGKRVTWALAGVALLGVALEYRTALALEPQVALLITAFILKLLELKTLRDHWLLLLLCYFLVACGFIFSTSIGAVAIAVGQLFVLLMAQQSLFRPTVVLRPMLASTGKVFAQSIPLMLVLFVVFPRFGPLWSVPLPGESGKTGVSDSMAPGDVSKLSRSSELAFRATFTDRIPPQQTLYWRGLVLDHFDGREWTRDKYARRPADAANYRGQSIGYEVILEHGVHEWLYVLAPARVDREGAYQDAQFQWLTRSALIGRVRYEAASYPQAPLDSELDNYNRFRNLQLPADHNPRARALAREWRVLEPAQRLEAARAFFQGAPFTYTLEPPTLGKHSVDDFIFGQRRGFCEHYASSLVVLLRAAGLPARVVVGYQGGERNDAGGYLLVHQSDAHAWTEVWLEGEGWVRVDPTAWVAPDRIELGADVALAGESGFLADSGVSLRRFGNLQLVSQLRLWLDRVEYQWVRWIVNFDTERQWDILANLFGDIDNRRLALIILAALAIPLLISALLTVSWRRRETVSAEVKAYRKCCARLSSFGLERRKGETPGDFARRVAAANPALVEWIDGVTQAFTVASYSRVNSADAEEAIRTMRQLARDNPLNPRQRRPA